MHGGGGGASSGDGRGNLADAVEGLELRVHAVLVLVEVGAHLLHQPLRPAHGPRAARTGRRATEPRRQHPPSHSARRRLLLLRRRQQH